MCFKNVFLAESSPTNSCNYNVDHHYGGSPDSMGPASTPFYDSYSYYGDYSDPKVTDLLNGYDFPCATTVPSTPLTHQLHLEQQSTSPMSFSSDSSPPNFHEHYSQRYTPSSTSRPTTLSANRPVYNGFASPPEYAYRVPPNPDGHLPSFLQIMQGLDGYSPGGGGADLDIKGFAVPPSTNLGGNGGATSPLQQQSICKVCGDVASGNHFGVLSCEACKSFFRRSVRAGARYACRSSRGCTIEKHTRNRCQYCRLQKCMQMGMRKEAVQEERAPPVSKLQRAGTPTQLGYTPPAPNYSIASIPHLPMQSSYRSFDSPVSPVAPTNLISQSRMFGSLPNLKMGMDSQPLTPPSLSYDMYSNNGSRPVTPTPPNTTMGSGTAMYPPDCTLGGIPGNNNQANQVSATVLVNADIQTDLPPENVTTSDHGVKLEDIFEGARQSLLRVIEWGKRIPAFTGLSLDDQVKLLKSCWCEHVLLKLATRIGPRSETLLLSSGITCRKDQIEDPEIRRIVDRISHEISYWFDVMHVDRVEMACLKGIILFNPDARGLSPGTRKRVEIFQEQILSALESRCRSLYPVTPLRFSKLLLRLPPLRSAALEATQHMEVQRTLGNTKMDNIFSELLDFD